MLSRMWLTYLTVVCIVSLVTCRNHKVSVYLRADWAETSLIAEAGEFLVDDSPEYFWKYVDILESVVISGHLHSKIHQTNGRSSQMDVNQFLELEKAVISSFNGQNGSDMSNGTNKANFFRLFLSSRFYSPSVEMNHQTALTTASQLFNCSHADVDMRLSQFLSGSSWAHVGDRVVHDPSELRSLLTSYTNVTSITVSLSREKVYRPKSTPNETIPTVILYGDLGKKDFYGWHSELKSLSEGGLCTYIFRHYLKDRPRTKPFLSGYGVELALKSTEYKAMDDTKLEESGSTDNEAPEDAVIQGFNFTRLETVHPDRYAELKEFQKHLIDTDAEIRPLKVWQFRDLGLQASEAVMESARNGFVETDESSSAHVHPGLLALRDMSQNLPARASRLVTTVVSSSFTDELAANQQILTSTGIPPGHTTFLVNGLLLSPTVDIFALLDLLRLEHKTMSMLRNLGIPGGRISELMIAADTSRRSHSSESTVPGIKYSLSGRFALDLTKSPIAYVNNLETDAAYAYWPDSLHALFAMDFSGGIRRVRRNLYNVVLVVDPASESSHPMIRLVESFLLHKTAIRFGFLWSVDPSTFSPSLVLVRMFNYISSTIMRSSESPLPTSVPGLGSPGAMAALSFLTELYAEAERTGRALDVEFIQKRFEKLFPNAYVEDIIPPAPGESEYDSQLLVHQNFLNRSGLNTVERLPLLIFNGIIFDQPGVRKMGGFEDAVVSLCMEEMIRVQHALYHGELSNTNNIFDLYRKSGSVVPRFNARILVAANAENSLHSEYLKFGYEPSIRSNDSNTDVTDSELLTTFADSMRYFQKGELESALRPLTMWVIVGDVDAILEDPGSPTRNDQLKRDLSLARSAINYIRSAQASKGLRIGFLFNPSTESSVRNPDHWLALTLHLIGRLTQAPMQGNASHPHTVVKYMEPMSARNFANRLLIEAIEALNGSAIYPTLPDLVVSGVDPDTLRQAIRQTNRHDFIQRHSVVSRRILGLKPGERAVVVNGKMIGPFGPTEEFTVDDFRLAERIALESGVEKFGETVWRIMREHLSGPDAASELTWRLASILHPRPDTSGASITDTDAVEGILSKTRTSLDGLSFIRSGFEIPANLNELAFDVLALVNPCSREAQRLSHVLIVLQQALSCRMRIVLNAIQTLSELPVKSFYRFVWEPSPFTFTSSMSSATVGPPDSVIPHALFTHLPGQPLLTLGMDTPHGWMVAAKEAVHDLDNLRLSDIHTTVEAVFELEHLLLEGHCFEESSMKPPRGLQLTLGPASDVGRYDTIVMANLGYFQLKAGPGTWHLNIRSGRSRDLYTMSEDDQTCTLLSPSELLITIDSFRSKIITMRVQKRPERLTESLLDETGITSTKSIGDSWNWLYKNSDVWSTISNYAQTLCPSWLTSLRKSLQPHLPWQTCAYRQETINVFSLASGHMYERLLRIMMLTVLRHTKSPVKFWFLKNYLSPTFKDFIPHMASEYGFDYELVQYQWPRWLHAQTEKQRIIWGYKILFLDVLFPLNVTKIIYVDADQIVRADLQELADLDLGGAPYGYTPFCDSRTEMDGFRFWKQGYWANHLAGRPYHISALYVVDLMRFRQLAAGDRLRGQYHGLSQDPNSLSNLDQDLPNNMIHQVPIKSLPQEWLWCETWCSDSSKARAKTIDLCNNPLTKEPKLSAAMRIAPEWVSYDREIKKLWQRIYPPTKPQPSPTAAPEVSKREDPLVVPVKPADSDTDQCSSAECPTRSPFTHTDNTKAEMKSEL